MNPYYLFALGFVFLAFVGIVGLEKGWSSRLDERKTAIMILVCCLAGVIATIQGTLR